MITVLQSICLPGNPNPSARNEDKIFISPHCVAVLDGATSLLPTEYNATWFVSEFVAAFSEILKRGVSVVPAVSAAVSAVYDLFREKYTTQEYFPSAGGVFAYEQGQEICVFHTGDCSAHITLKDGRLVSLDESPLRQLDNAVLTRAVQIRQETGGNICDIMKTDEIRQMLLQNRKKMNALNGYPVLAFNMAPISETQVLHFKKDEVRKILLYTDGFSHQAACLMKPDVDLQEVYHAVRDCENADPLFNKIPRFKHSDDCAALVLRID